MMYKVLLRVFFALILGFFVALWLAGRDPRIHRLFERRLISTFQEMLACKLEGTIVHINFLSPTMIFVNAGASSHTPGDWQWHAKQCTFTFSYLELLKTRTLAVNVHLDGMQSESVYCDGQLPLTEHLKRLVSFENDVPVALKKLLVTNGKMILHTKEHDSSVSLDFKSEASTIGSQFRTTMYVTSGDVVLQTKRLVHALDGMFAADISRDPEHPGHTGFVDVTLKIPQLPLDDQQCSLHATWKDTALTCTLSNKQETCAVHHADIMLTPSGGWQADVHTTFPLAYGAALYHGTSAQGDVHGACTLDAHVNAIGTEDQKVTATLSLDQCGMRSMGVEHIDACINAEHGTWHAAFNVHDPLFELLEGTLTWHEKDARGTITLETGAHLSYAPFKYWHVLPHDIHVNAHFDAAGTLKGRVNATAHHEKLGTKAAITGNLKVDQKQFLLTGSVNDKPYVIDVALSPRILLNNIHITDQKGEQLIAMKAGPHEQALFEGLVAFPFLRTMIMSLTGYDVRGKGDINVKTALKGSKLYGQLLLSEGNVRLSNTYNYMQEILVPLEVDVERRRCVIMGSHIKLHKGNVRCQRATIDYNEQNEIVFAHVPLMFNKVFLNAGKDMFVVVSGYVVLTYTKDNVPFIQGTLSVERAQVKQNILSGNVQSTLLKDLSSSLIGSSADVAFDIRLINRHPIQVRTNVLHTDLDMQLRCTGSLSAPRVEGTVNLAHGTLQFPYRPLSIINGMLHIEPHQPDDPRIDLMAKGTIKRYTVTMQVGGTVRNPTFNFSSSPSLDEEQIITLLLAGSEAGSLSLVMPSLIMQNVQNYIFGSDHGSSTVETYVNNVLAPFKHIRIIPSFSDQTARGGFRGAIEIDVSDRLHATIQKNFSLTEDTRVEVEFKVSDDMNIRGIKDERNDLGGEIEARISF